MFKIRKSTVDDLKNRNEENCVNLGMGSRESVSL